MKSFPFFRILGSSCAVLSLTACVTYDPPPQASKPVPTNVDSWTKIPTTNWDSVPYAKRDEALALLGQKDWVHISKSVSTQLLQRAPDTLLPAKQTNIPTGWQPYLVKGRGYGVVGGKVRFNRPTGELSVFLAAYNGEISFPGMRWSVEDLPVVVALPRPPSRIRQSAEIGGDSILRMTDRE